MYSISKSLRKYKKQNILWRKIKYLKSPDYAFRHLVEYDLCLLNNLCQAFYLYNKIIENLAIQIKQKGKNGQRRNLFHIKFIYLLLSLSFYLGKSWRFVWKKFYRLFCFENDFKHILIKPYKWVWANYLTARFIVLSIQQFSNEILWNIWNK